MANTEPKSKKMSQLTISISALVMLCLCLCVTSFALGYAVFEVQNNRFQTGGIELDLNGGQPVITADEYLFEPGMTVEKPFYIKNKGTWAVYTKLYFTGVSGSLGDVLDVTIMEVLEGGDRREVVTGKLSQLTMENVPALESELAPEQRQDMVIRFHFPEGAGNDTQGDSLTFTLSAVAVQTKNNPDKEFD